MIRPILLPARRKRKARRADVQSKRGRARLERSWQRWARRLDREARVLAYLNMRAEKQTEERLAEAWATFPDELLPTALEKMRTGEAKPALVRAKLSQWIDAISRLPPPPGMEPREHQFWINALRQISDGRDIDPAVALRLKIGHRRPAKERDLLAARDAWWQIHCENVPPEQAFAKVARPLAVTPKHVRDLYYKNRAALATFFGMSA